MSRCRDTKIVDRKHEVHVITNAIKEHKESKLGAILVIWSDSGYGKSSIVKKVKDEAEYQVDIISIEPPPTNIDQTPVDGRFISYIALAIDKFYSDSLSFKYFLHTGSRLYTQRQQADILEVAHSATSAIGAVLGIGLSSELDAKRILGCVDDDSTLIQVEYIEYVYKATQFVLNIPNFQNIDAVSYRAFCNMLQSNPTMFCIVEYTTVDCKTDTMLKVIDDIPIPVKYLKISELPFEYALSIYRPDSSNDIRAYEDFYHKIVHGNLFKLKQLKAERGDMSNIWQNDPLKERIHRLNYSSKLVLAIVCLHDGYLHHRTFNEILSIVSQSFFIQSDALDIIRDLIIDKNGAYTLAHASIIDEFDLSFDNHAALTAYRFLKEYYLRKIESSNPLEQQDAVLRLLKLFLRFDPLEIPGLFTQFRQMITTCVSEVSAFDLLKQAFNIIDVKKYRELAFSLIYLCYQVGLYSGALCLLKCMAPFQNAKEQLLFCMLLNRNDEHEHAISLCNKQIHNRHCNDRLKLSFYLVRMLSERSLNRKTEYQKTSFVVFCRYARKNYLEYGFFLRNLQIVFPYRKSLAVLKKSIEYFMRFDEEQYAAQSALTYIIQMSRLGWPVDYNNAMDEIERHIWGTTFEKHIIYTNRAAIAILCGDKGYFPIELLRKAQLTATTVFDRIAILNNMICWYISRSEVNEEFDNVKAQVLRLLSKEPDIRSSRKTYTNLFLYYNNVICDSQTAEYWRNMAISLHISSSKLMIEDIMLGLKKPDKDLKYLATKKYCISFITYWHFDLPLDDE